MFNWYGKGLKIGDLHLPTPIVQGGMGIGVSGRKLAVAVAEAGGIGVISAVGLGYVGIPCEIEENKEESRNISILRQEIRKAKQATKGALGVNIMVAISEFAETARAAVEEGIDVIFAGAGLPLNLPASLIEGSKTKLVPIVSSARTAKLIAKRWMSHYQYAPDGFVVEGPMAGGHLGFSKEQIDDPAYRLENLVPEVVEEAKKIEEDAKKSIPVIAAGGVYTGEDIYRMLSLGASGVQMATRFVATEECDADLAFKQAYINCTKEDIGIIESPVGLPGRAIINEFLTDAKKGLKNPKNCRRHCIKTCKEEGSPYCISSALINAVHGKIENGFAFIGANGYRVDRILTVAQLFEELEEDFRARYEQETVR
ncbi:MAG: nitronate monooxygenase [Anaerovorax sp.]|nr:nitronate monooxygenase [Anaerovorax sp.]